MILLDIDPNVVKPGWTPLIILIILAGAVVLLYRSMRHQVRRINVPGSTPPVVAGEDPPAGEPTPSQTPSDEPGPETPRTTSSSTG
jgi:hypothetical protein